MPVDLILGCVVQARGTNLCDDIGACASGRCYTRRNMANQAGCSVHGMGIVLQVASWSNIYLCRWHNFLSKGIVDIPCVA
jgi:hypothetical protein